MPFAAIAHTGDVPQEARRLVQVLAGEGPKACEDFTCYNAGAVLWVAGKCDSLREGVAGCREVIKSGRALDKLRHWVSVQSGADGEGPQRLQSLLQGM